MKSIYEKLIACRDCIKEKTEIVPKVALVLGSGLGGFAHCVDVKDTVDYRELKSFPVSTVPGHEGRFIFGHIENVPVVLMQGRVHYYEGYSIQDVVMPIRIMGLLGAKVLFLTNAAGGINKDFHAGDLMMLTGQIGSFIPSPLIGANIDELGTRFTDMSEVYSKRLRNVIENTAKSLNIPLRHGVYVQTTGPQYETPDEIRMYGLLGADAVGMSTACEAIAARHMGLEICGISCIANLAAGISKTPLSHKEVQESADRTAPVFEALVRQSIINISDAIK